VLESAGSGAGRHVLDLAAGLLRRGHEVHLAWSPVRSEPAFAAGLAALPSLVGHPVAMDRAPGVRDLRAATALRRLIRAHGFDVVHGHSSKAGALARIACAFSRVPALYTPHAFVTLDPQLGAPARTLYVTAERVLASLGARIVCVSPEERDHALGLGIAAHRLAVVPNGLAPLPAADRAGARAALGLDGGAVCVGFVGRLTRQKAVARLVAAFARACPAGSPARLAIVGEGPEHAALVRLAGTLGVSERVVMAGAGDGPALMAAFDLFVLPSRYEAFPYVLLEAAARALPIVTTAVGGAAIVVRAGENGWIVPEAAADAETAAALAAPIAGLVGDAVRRSEMGRRSAAIAAGLGVDAMVERTLALYREVLARQ
jgi:glycosyltransferase involved in cell wall biosynthesis